MAASYSVLSRAADSMDVRDGLKKAERRRIDAFEWWCVGEDWRAPWTARRSDQDPL